MAQKINENDIQFNNSIPVPGNSGAPATPATGKASIYGIGTSNLRPGFINEGGTAEVIMTNAGTTGTTLGYAQITANFSNTSTTASAVTGLSVTVTIPSGGRRVKITAWGRSVLNNTAGDYSLLSIWDGTVGTGTQLAETAALSSSASAQYSATVMAVVTPSAGSKTYAVGLCNASTAGTNTLTASTVAPAFILVELI